MAAIAGLVFGHAWTLQAAAWWWIGAATLSSGTLLVLSGVFARGTLPKGAAPFLGDLLVFKGWVTDGQLADALVRQHHTGRPLGRILVEMKLLSPSQLAQALEEQLEYRDTPNRSDASADESQASDSS